MERINQWNKEFVNCFQKGVSHLHKAGKGIAKHHKLVVIPALKATAASIKTAIERALLNLSRRIDKVSFSKNKSLEDEEVFFIGATKVASFDPGQEATKLYYKEYIEELVPINVDGKQLFFYRKTLKPFVDEWVEKKKSKETLETFSDYMAEKIAQSDDLKASLESTIVRYFDEQDRHQTEVHIEKKSDSNQFFLSQIGIDSTDDNTKHLEKGTYIFVLADVIDQKGKITSKFFAAPKISTKKGKIQHTSFMRGGNVKSAGMLEIDENGRISLIRNHSGHYRPTAKEIAFLVDYLDKNGYDTASFYINYYKSNIFLELHQRFNIKIDWGIVNQRADKWFERTGRHLIEKPAE